MKTFTHTHTQTHTLLNLMKGTSPVLDLVALKQGSCRVGGEVGLAMASVTQVCEGTWLSVAFS